jgi:hypothetical protein
MKRIIIGSAVAVCAFSFGMGAASAATPAVQGCVGSSVSPLASSSSSAAPGAYGQAIVGFVKTSATPGLGADVQALQAGVVPDEIVPNTCNGG